MGCVVVQSGAIAAQNTVTSSVSFVYKRSINTHEYTPPLKKRVISRSQLVMKSVAMLPAEGGPSLTRDGSCVSSALLGDAHTHCTYARNVCFCMACMHACVCVLATKSWWIWWGWLCVCVSWRPPNH